MKALSIPSCVGALALGVSAQVANYCEQRLTASDALVQDHFGAAVSVDGTTVAIGAPDADHQGSHSGRVYVDTRSASGWSEQAFTGSNAFTGDAFGAALDLDGDTLAAGAPSDAPGGNFGAAYVFVRNAGVWSEQQRLVPNDNAIFDLFGAAVALDGDTLLIGSPRDDDFGNESGSVYVFERAAGVWTQSAKLHASNPSGGSWLGFAVALDGDTAVVAAPAVSSTITPYAYVFTRNGGVWSEQQVLAAPGAFDAALALDGDTALVASSQAGLYEGEVFAYVRNGSTWSLQQAFAPADVAIGDGFGAFSIGLAGDTAVISSPYDEDGVGSNFGSTYVFVRSGGVWQRTAKLRGSQTADDDRAGATAFDGASIAVGAAYAGHSGQGDAGEAYVFALTPGIDTYCTAKTNSMGCTPWMNACGASSASAGSGFAITCYKVLDGTNGLMFYGYAPHAAPFQDGTLCVQPATRRTPVQLAQNVQSNGSCRSVFRLDFNAWIASGVDPLLVPGANVYAQWWMRDPASASTTGLSNGVTFAIGP